jgi:diketogulonate reductase-like aldo/keto reductase
MAEFTPPRSFATRNLHDPRSVSPSSDLRKECSAAAVSEKAAIALISRLAVQMTLISGYRVPALGFGTYSNSDSPSVMGDAVYAAVKVGYRHFDCAESYKNEAAIGSSLERCFREGLVERSELFITSKVWQTNHDPENVYAACKNTLSNLNLTYVDCYLIHWPLAWEYTSLECEPLVPTNGTGRVTMSTSGCSMQDTWRAMERLVDEGLANSIGVSNFSSAQLADLVSYARIKPSINQIECHPMLPQQNLRKMCKINDIKVVSYAPLGRPGNLHEGDPSLLQHSVVVRIAEEKGLTPAQVLLQWQMDKGLAAIPKSTSFEHMTENLSLDKLGKWIDTNDVAALDSLGTRHRFCNKKWNYGCLVFDD